MHLKPKSVTSLYHRVFYDLLMLYFPLFYGRLSFGNKCITPTSRKVTNSNCTIYHVNHKDNSHACINAKVISV